MSGLFTTASKRKVASKNFIIVVVIIVGMVLGIRSYLDHMIPDNQKAQNKKAEIITTEKENINLEELDKSHKKEIVQHFDNQKSDSKTQIKSNNDNMITTNSSNKNPSTQNFSKSNIDLTSSKPSKNRVLIESTIRKEKQFPNNQIDKKSQTYVELKNITQIVEKFTAPFTSQPTMTGIPDKSDNTTEEENSSIASKPSPKRIAKPQTQPKPKVTQVKKPKHEENIVSQKPKKQINLFQKDEKDSKKEKKSETVIVKKPEVKKDKSIKPLPNPEKKRNAEIRKLISIEEGNFKTHVPE